MPLASPKEITFKNHLVQINVALDQGDLVTNDLKIVQKHGIKWAWIRFTHAIISIFSSCTHQDAWKAYRINNLASGLSNYVKNNSPYLNAETESQLENIYSKLQVKANRSTHKKEEYTKALDIFHKAFKIDVRIDVKIDVKLPKAQTHVHDAITNFANGICVRLAEQHPNKSFSISPVSLIAALGMCLHIISPAKKEQFIEKIGLKGRNEEEVHAVIAATLREMDLPKEFENGTMKITQGLAVREKNSMTDSLHTLIKKAYRANIIVATDLKEAVNEWINTEMRHNIPKSDRDKIIISDTDVFVLLNAIHLNFQWKEEFRVPRKGWEVEEFTCIDGSKAPVSKMVHKGNYLLSQGENFEMLEKDYLSPEGRKLSQLIFLPNDPKEFANLEKNLTAEAIRMCRQQSKRQEVVLKMPKIEVKSEHHLLEILKAAEFPLDDLDINIVHDRDVYISDIIHKTFISPPQQLTEADEHPVVCAEKCVREPKVFDIKHSYTYMIMDGDKVLFRGRITDKKPLLVDW